MLDPVLFGTEVLLQTYLTKLSIKYNSALITLGFLFQIILYKRTCCVEITSTKTVKSLEKN